MSVNCLYEPGELVKLITHEIHEEGRAISEYWEYWIVTGVYLVTEIDTYEYSSRTPCFTYTLVSIADRQRKTINIPEHKLIPLTDSEESYIRLLYGQK